MCICERLFSACRSECEREEGKQRYNVRMQRGIPGNPADMGIPPRPGRHMALSGPLAADQYRNKHRWIRLSKHSINGDAQKALKNRRRQSWFSIQAPRRGKVKLNMKRTYHQETSGARKKKKKPAKRKLDSSLQQRKRVCSLSHGRELRAASRGV